METAEETAKYNIAETGDPIISDNDDREVCDEEYTENCTFMICTRAPGHVGQHVAEGIRLVRMTW